MTFATECKHWDAEYWWCNTPLPRYLSDNCDDTELDAWVPARRRCPENCECFSPRGKPVVDTEKLQDKYRYMRQQLLELIATHRRAEYLDAQGVLMATAAGDQDAARQLSLLQRMSRQAANDLELIVAGAEYVYE